MTTIAATTTTTTTKPGKLASKFGAAFAAFEKNDTGNGGGVPLAFQSINNKNKTRRNNSKFTSSSKKKTAEKENSDSPPRQSKLDTGITTTVDAPVVVKRNFRVSSTLASRARMFESGSSSNIPIATDRKESTDQSYKNAFQTLRRVDGQGSTIHLAEKKTAEKPVANVFKQQEIVAKSEYLSDDEYTEIEIKSDDEDLWEEHTVDSTNPDEDSCDWDVEIIEEELYVDSD